MRADKRRLIRALSKKTGVAQRFVEQIVVAAGEVTAEIADERGECRWPGFGRFRLSPVRGVFTFPCGEDYRDVTVNRRTLRYKPYRAVRRTLDRRTGKDEQGEKV